jgi:hypothetical protein
VIAPPASFWPAGEHIRDGADGGVEREITTCRKRRRPADEHVGQDLGKV